MLLPDYYPLILRPEHGVTFGNVERLKEWVEVPQRYVYAVAT